VVRANRKTEARKGGAAYETQYRSKKLGGVEDYTIEKERGVSQQRRKKTSILQEVRIIRGGAIQVKSLPMTGPNGISHKGK